VQINGEDLGSCLLFEQERRSIGIRNDCQRIQQEGDGEVLVSELKELDEEDCGNTGDVADNKVEDDTRSKVRDLVHSTHKLYVVQSVFSLSNKSGYYRCWDK
jgi:hypothetical protein